MNDSRTRFEAWWPSVGQTIGEVAAWEAWQARDAELEAARAKLAEAQAMIAMQHDALKECAEDMADWAGYASEYFQEKHDLAGDIARYQKVISVTIETVAAWEADKQEKWNEESNSLIGQQDIEIENLRGEVAMLRDLCIWMSGCGYDFCQHDYWVKHRSILIDTQTTALAYEETIRKAERERILGSFEFFSSGEGEWLAKAIREMK